MLHRSTNVVYYLLEGPFTLVAFLAQNWPFLAFVFWALGCLIVVGFLHWLVFRWIETTSQVFYWRPRWLFFGISWYQDPTECALCSSCRYLQWLCWLFLKWPGAAPLLNWGRTSLVPSVPLWGGPVQRASQVPARWPPTQSATAHEHRLLSTTQEHNHVVLWCLGLPHTKKQKHIHNHTPRRLIKPALFNKRNPNSSALVHNTIREVQTQTQKHKRLPASFQCIESSGYSKHRSTKTSTIVLHCSQITFPGSKNTSTNTAK